MHSLKNTFVAVGLLGLSFLFYQASTKPNPNAHLSNEVPSLSISDGIDEFTRLAPDSVGSGLDAMKSKLGNLPNLQMPDLSKPKQMVSDMASDFKNQASGFTNQLSNKASQLKQQVSHGISDFQLDMPQASDLQNQLSSKAAQLKQQVSDGVSNLQLDAPQVNDFKNQLSNKAAQLKQQVSDGISDFQLEAPVLNTPQLNTPQLNTPQLDAPQRRLQFNAPAPRSSQNLAPVNAQRSQQSQLVTRQPQLDTNARDQGLIAALKSQADQRRSQTAKSSNEFLTAPSKADSSQFQFASQPIPSGDSSFNRLAANRSSGPDTNVFQANAEPAPTALSFEAAWNRVDQLVEAEDFAGALGLLSQYYRRDDLSADQRKRLNGWLDALAGKVIFSTEHHLEGQPFTVGNESLTDISSRWGVPAQLVYNINKSKIPNPAFVHSGTELKVVRGPFNCEIDMSENMMTLFLGNLYAGRYPVKIGISGNPKPGDYRVLAKSTVGHSWRDAAGNEYPPSSPQNGYGPNWIGLSRSLCIHATKADVTGNHSGCIGLSNKDSKDVFGILSKSSNVKIVP